MQSLLLPSAAPAPLCKHLRPSRVSVRASAAVGAPRRETDPKKRVVITGMGLVSVFGNDVDAYYDRLLAGHSGVRNITRFDASKFPTRFAAEILDFSSEGYVDKRLELAYCLDDFQRYALVASKKALESAGLAPGSSAMEKIDKEKAGVIVGSGVGAIGAWANGVESLLAGSNKPSQEDDKGSPLSRPFCIPHAVTNTASALVAITTGFEGPNYSISTACATSNHCINSAADQIRLGKANVIIAGGTEAPIVPIGLGGFVASRALSQRNDDPTTASRPWDKDRDGFVMGEGAGVLVMESLEHAMRRGAPILAEYLGGAGNSDAYHRTKPRPDGSGISSCIKRSLEAAGVAPEEVNYINAHATSTTVGDPVEVAALEQVFKDPSQIKMNATKSMIGHCLGAAGGLEAIATIKAITTGWVHPTINQFNPITEVEVFDTVRNVKQDHEILVGISNSFGFGGHNSVVVFAPFKP
ncbi:unnamed protein product [Alopecurus aequalis]